MKNRTVNTVGKLAWHVHHDVLLEPLTEPIEARQQYIKKNKPTTEIATRLRLLRLVKGPIPTKAPRKACKKLYEAYEKRREAHEKWVEAEKERLEAYEKWQDACEESQEAEKEWRETYEEWQEACKKHYLTIEKLHAKECPDCPWNGETIFP